MSLNVSSQNKGKIYSTGKNNFGKQSIFIDNKSVSLGFIEKNTPLDANGKRSIEKIKSNRRLRFLNAIAAGTTLGFGISNLINNPDNLFTGSILTASGIIFGVNIHYLNKEEKRHFQDLLVSMRQAQKE